MVFCDQKLINILKLDVLRFLFNKLSYLFITLLILQIKHCLGLKKIVFVKTIA